MGLPNQAGLGMYMSPEGGGDGTGDILSQLTPEQLQQLIELGSMDEQQSDLDAQLQQALAASQPMSAHHTTPQGAALGGVADLFRGISGAHQERRARESKAGLSKKQEDARKLFASLMGGGQKGFQPYQPAQEESLKPATPFSYGGQYGYVPGGY